MLIRVLLTAFLLFSGAFANSVAGVVTFDGYPISGVDVHILGVENGYTFDVVTNDDGTFMISGLPEWKQLFLVVLLPNLEAQTNHPFIHYGGSEPMTINLELGKPTAPAYAGADNAHAATPSEALTVATELTGIMYTLKPNTLEGSLRNELQ